METLTFKNSTVELKLLDSSRTLRTAEVVRAIQSEAVRGMSEEPIRECVRWRVQCGKWTIYILELKPAFRWIRWLHPKSPIPYGAEARYEDRRLATPYVILKVPFLDGNVVPRCEVFYRNEAVTHIDGELSWCNLLNVSPDSYDCTAWFCTQYLELRRGRRRSRERLTESEQLDAVLTHLWGGGFNLSSENHEGRSCFSKARDDGLDPRVIDVDKWQAASVADPNFVLGVKWKSTGQTVRRLLERELTVAEARRDLSETGEIVNLLLAEPQKAEPQKAKSQKAKPQKKGS